MNRERLVAPKWLTGYELYRRLYLTTGARLGDHGAS